MTKLLNFAPLLAGLTIGMMAMTFPAASWDAMPTRAVVGLGSVLLGLWLSVSMNAAGRRQT